MPRRGILASHAVSPGEPDAEPGHRDRCRPALAAGHFARRLAFETDCADVHDALSRGAVDFVLLEARGPATYARGHAPGALNLPHREITEERLAAWPRDALFVVYCAGPHCNGADRAALRLARFGRRVKAMAG